MAISPTIEFTEADLTRINIALLMLEETFAGKLINGEAAHIKAFQKTEIENLSSLPANELEELTLTKPAFANIQDWDKDERAREQLNPIAMRLKDIAQQVLYTNRAVLQRCWNSSAKY